MPTTPANAVDYLSPRVLMGLLEELPLIQDHIGGQFFPMKEVPGDRMIYDLIKQHAPLASFTAPGAESPRLSEPDILQQISVDSAYIRSKISLRENDVRWLRNFGDATPTTQPGQMARAARDTIARNTQMLSDSVDRRIEKMEIDTLLGALVVTPATADNANRSEVNFSVSYPVVTVTAGGVEGSNNAALWSTVADADPLADMLNWFQSLRYNMSTMICSRRVMNLLARSVKLRGNVLINTPVGQPTVIPLNTVKRFIQDEVGINVIQYDSVYTTRSEVLTGGIPIPTDTSARYLPDNKVIFLPAGPQGYFATAPAPQNQWKSGKFLFPLDPEETGRKDPWVFEIVCGIYGIPVFFYPDRVYVATVAS